MTALSGIWDGELHWMKLDEHFMSTGCWMVVDDWEELEEEDELSPFESPSLTPVLRYTGVPLPHNLDEMFPLRGAEQAWGSLSVVLTAFAKVAEVEKKQFEHVWPGQGSTKREVKWSFQATDPISERV